MNAGHAEGADADPKRALGDARILLDDPPILIVWKPAGLATQAPPGFDSLVLRLKEYLRLSCDKPGNVYLGVPHRLDRPVAGVLVFARNSKSARRLAEQFRDRQVRKIYVAVVDQAPEPASGSLVHWIAKEKDSAVGRVVEPFRPDAKECSLRYRTVGQAASGTVLEIELGTGRYHQIRIQLSAIGSPVNGDEVYGSKRAWPGHADHETKEPAEWAGSIALFACRLTIFHPIRYDLTTIIGPPPTDWPDDVCELLRTTAGRADGFSPIDSVDASDGRDDPSTTCDRDVGG